MTIISRLRLFTLLVLATVPTAVGLAQQAPPLIALPDDGIAKDAKPIDSQQNRSDLEQQFLKLQKSLEIEDAFSEKLGEDYMDYGALLRASGEYPEAMDAFVNALHIAKVNNGIYSLEQRAALTALFETNFLLARNKESEGYLKRILWIEKKNLEADTDVSFGLQLRLGRRYLDQYLSRPNRSEKSMAALLSAKRHFASAMRLNQDRPLDELVMPYGEMALIGLLGNSLALRRNRVGFNTAFSPTINSPQDYFAGSYALGERYLNHYLRKAREQQSQRDIVRALLGLGDYYQWFKRQSRAIEMYQSAWQEVQLLDAGDALRSSFDKPVELPNFYSATTREVVESAPNTVTVPLVLEINANGRVESVAAESIEPKKVITRARRNASRQLFRPRMVDGQMVMTSAFDYSIEVSK